MECFYRKKSGQKSAFFSNSKIKGRIIFVWGTILGEGRVFIMQIASSFYGGGMEKVHRLPHWCWSEN